MAAASGPGWTNLSLAPNRGITISTGRRKATSLPIQFLSEHCRGLPNRLRHQRFSPFDTLRASRYTRLHRDTAKAHMPEQARISQVIQVDDIVAYTDSFLDRHSRFHIDMPAAIGTVKALHHVRTLTFADVEWNKPGLPKRVNVKYLNKKLNT